MTTLEDALRSELALRRHMAHHQREDVVRYIARFDIGPVLAETLRTERDWLFYRAGEANAIASIAQDNDLVDLMSDALRFKDECMTIARGLASSLVVITEPEWFSEHYLAALREAA